MDEAMEPDERPKKANAMAQERFDYWAATEMEKDDKEVRRTSS